MTDIVERLRKIDTGLISVDAMDQAKRTAHEAADEIERLRRVIAEAQMADEE